jgi:hypothetical protein
MRNSHIILFTIQKKGHDITVKHTPLGYYTCEGEPYYEMAQYLKWDYWIWTFPALNDFNNDWMSIPLNDDDLWTLSVPSDLIKWCALSLQCKNTQPVVEWFFLEPESIRKWGDIPQGLIEAPIRLEWVIRIQPFQDILEPYVQADLCGKSQDMLFIM